MRTFAFILVLLSIFLAGMAFGVTFPKSSSAVPQKRECGKPNNIAPASNNEFGGLVSRRM